ncbi:hypothetical protein [Streptomyces sp. NPDC055085]
MQITTSALAVLPMTISLILVIAVAHPDEAVRERALRAVETLFGSQR